MTPTEDMIDNCGIIQIDTNRPPSVLEPSPGLSEILARVEKFIVIPNSDKMAPTALKTMQKQRREKAVAEVAKLLPVTDDTSFTAVAALVSECAGIKSSIVKGWEKAKKAAHEAHKVICDMESRDIEAKEIVREAADKSCNVYRLEQRRQQLIREQEEAAKAAAESRRLQAEADARAAEARKLEAEAAEAKRQGDIKGARAALQQAAAVTEEVAEIKEQAEIAAEVYHEPVMVPKVEGRSEKWPWGGKGVDAMALIKAIAAGEYPLMHTIPVRGGGEETVSILEFNQAVITHYAKRLEANAKIPGVEFAEQLQASYRSK